MDTSTEYPGDAPRLFSAYMGGSIGWKLLPPVLVEASVEASSSSSLLQPVFFVYFVKKNEVGKKQKMYP